MSAKAKKISTRTKIYILIVALIIIGVAYFILNLPEEKPKYNLDQIFADPDYYIEKGEIIVIGYYYSQEQALIKTTFDNNPYPEKMLRLDNVTGLGLINDRKYEVTGELHYVGETPNQTLELIVKNAKEV